MTTITQLQQVELKDSPMSSTNDIGDLEPHFSTTAIPDGGYGWIIVFCAAITTFWINAMINCWGVLQSALLSSTMSHSPASTVSFIGSLNLACGVGFGLFATRAARSFGSKTTAMSGILLMGVGQIAASFSTRNIAGMFVTIGLVVGVGMSAVYTISNALPVQYFSGRLGLANGLVKLGGGIGGTVMAVALQALVDRVGIEWTFRIQGCMTIATGLPAAWFMRDLTSTRNTPFVDFSMFRSRAFVAVFVAGAIGTFALFVPPYYLPLFAQSLGLSSSTGATLVAAFNLCNAIGRFVSGPLCDKIGPTNTFLITMILNAVSMLAIWPVSNTLAPLVVFAAINGIANGSYFTVVPTVAASIFGPGRAAVAMSMSVTGWTVGYLLGAPIAGYLLQAAGGKGKAESMNIEAFRPAIFYAGGVALVSSLFVFIARVSMAKQVGRKV
ncbi:MFS transporter, MCP family, solute carrier family 16, member 10 [Aaosphaeria arxii CBS 175.79]|uniref:MFS transporter, MCP family, solute carrier family 16, member 10 n=1 Tax=Aaosphaeria arxii CBS 175.79 TaxID=1450172 RepID=A0A6A5XGQ0_9PLEO|nr:MFS transporter, MCP family, solute carrier family 16, member 10 [Aaosphaeria arxii CBS 175.79]KAF2012090.1 MFS transporter, MCP family, solute carrier family 16, member 10 [Aaosphaeria arxii CBS 175.79]